MQRERERERLRLNPEINPGSNWDSSPRLSLGIAN